MIGYRWYAPFVLFAALVAGIVSAEDTSRKQESKNKENSTFDLACGPRCVQFVLEQYGTSARLIPLMRETQWAELERGASLGHLRDALESRGIYTAAVQVDPDAEIVADTPIILHCQDSRGNGHFVVQVNCHGEKVIWDGLNGYRKGLPDGFRSTGIALITSHGPITDSSWRVVRGWLWQGSLLTVGCVALGAWCVVHIARSLKKRRPLVGETSLDSEALR